MFEKLICKDYSRAMSTVIERIKKRKPDLEVKTFFIVPDNYTLYVEKKLCEGTHGFFDVDVVSFNRLFFRLCKAEPLGREQAIMLLRTIIGGLNIECFVKSSRYRGFAEKLYDAIMLLKRNGVTPRDLKTFESPKWRDIVAVYEKYLEKSENYADLSSRVRLLKLEAEKGYFDGANVYAANFDLLTEEEKELFDIISARAGNFVFATVNYQASIDDVCKDFAVMDCNGSAEQLKEVALRISDAAYRGTPYSEMCVVCTGECRDHIRRIFGEYDIPYFLEYKYKFSSHPLPRYILAIFNVIRHGLRRRDVMEIVKNPCFGADKTETDIFEIFCEKFCIDFKGFESEFLDYEYDHLEIAEKTRVKLMRVVNRVRNLGRQKVSSEDFHNYIYETSQQLAPTVKEFDEETGINSPEEMIKIADFISKLTDCGDFEFLAEIFEDGINAVEVATLPNLSGSVAVGDVSSFRGQKFSYMFITDFNEGVLPVQSEESGIISDYDLSGLKLTTSIENNLRRRSELIMLLSSADKIFATCEKKAAGGRSMLLKSIMIKNSVIPFDRNEELNILYNDSEYLPFLAGSKPAAEELLLTAVSEYSLFGDKRGNVRDFAFPLYSALGDEIEKFFPCDETASLSPEKSRKLFSGMLSVSRISSFYKCPYLHFIKYGLRPERFETGEIRANDVGDILHKVAERFIGSYNGEDIDKFTEDLVTEIIGEHSKRHLIENPASFGYLLEEAKRGCRVLLHHFAAGKFVSEGEEVKFGYRDAAFKGPVFGFGNSELVLCGSIDYWDKWKNYARVVDYKTGANSKFDVGEIFYGLNLQLPLYSYVLKVNGYSPAGFFLFPFRIKWSTSEDGLRFDGIFDEELLSELDKGFEDGDYKSMTIKAYTKTLKDGTRKLYSASAVKPEVMNDIIDYSVALTAKAAESMAKGYILPKPFIYKNRTPCSYCDCRPICRYKDSKGFRQLNNKSTQDFEEGGKR